MRMRERRAILVISLLASLALAGVGQGQGSVGGGDYPGVVPGTDHAPTFAPAPGGGGSLVITWPGFQMLQGGGSRVFVQATGMLSTQMTKKGMRITIKLGHARLSHKNNGRPLDTHFFNTPVKRVDVQIKKGEALLVIDLKRDVTPTVTTAPGQGGFQFLYVDFPPAS